MGDCVTVSMRGIIAQHIDGCIYYKGRDGGFVKGFMNYNFMTKSLQFLSRH